MLSFAFKEDRQLQLEADEPLHSMYTLSPHVWLRDSRFELLLRAVNRHEDAAKKVARIYHGVSEDGITFRMDRTPNIAPGPGEDDLDGCEDPSVALDDGCLYVYYTGWNQRRKVGKLLLARGPEPCNLSKVGVALDSTGDHANPKEATIGRCKDGTWALFFEYARDNRSRIGIAWSEHVDGPWRVGADPIEARAQQWDEWHLSPGPLVQLGNDALMFYNGATAEAAWRIGWVLFNEQFSRILDRCKEPLITPPRPKGEDTDIAFAASVVPIRGETWLYYSIADKEMRRAVFTSP